MSTDMHPNSQSAKVPNDAYRLEPFGLEYSKIIADWIHTPEELFWLAPATPPPLTAEKVIGWSRADRSAYMLRNPHDEAPIGYAELGPMSDNPNHLWLGHFLIDPSYRGNGLGKLFLRRLLIEAMTVHRARRMSLVVFPANLPAIRCYQREGFAITNHEHRHFATTGQRHRLLRMVLDLATWAAQQQ